MTDTIPADSSSSDNEDTSTTWESELELFSFEDYKNNKLKDVDPDMHFFNNICNNCKYYNDNDILFLNKPENMSIIHLNCRSLYANFEQLKEFLNNLDLKFGLIALSETWINANKFGNFELDAYQMFKQNREHKLGGGVALYVHKDYKVRLIDNMTMAIDHMFECVTVEIIFEKRKNIQVSCVYRAPGANIEPFIEHFEKIFAYSNHKDIFICGDLNIDLLKANSHKPTENYVDTMYSLSLYPLITRPTRITAHSATLIDNIYTNVLKDMQSGILINDISDHLPVFTLFAIEQTSKKNNCDTMIKNIRITSEHSINDLNQSLSDHNWNDVLGEQDVNNAYRNFVNTVRHLYNHHCPVITRKCTWKEKSSPWMTKGLLNACKKKNSLYKTCIRERTLESETKYKKI